MSNEEVLQFVGQMPGGRHIILEVIATSPGFCLVRTHYINTEAEEIFQQKEPFVELPLELMADKMGHVMLMVGSLQAQLQLKVDGPNDQECALLVDALTGLIKVFSAEYGIEIGAIQEAGAPSTMTSRSVQAGSYETDDVFEGFCRSAPWAECHPPEGPC